MYFFTFLSTFQKIALPQTLHRTNARSRVERSEGIQQRAKLTRLRGFALENGYFRGLTGWRGAILQGGIALPIFPELSDGTVDRVCDAVGAFFC